MERKDLLFYDAYEAFYAMADTSFAFSAYCRAAFGNDFSQDGFSDTCQVDMILPYIPQGGDAQILDVGCGNGKMLGYLQQRTQARIHGFDYSAQAIRTALRLFPERSDFREGIIGVIDYPAASFDVIISMDTVYFAADMTAFVAQVKRWLKPGGVFFVGYQEGDVIPRTEDAHTTRLARAAAANGMTCQAIDLTRQTYELLKAKRRSALRHRKAFEAEGHGCWFDMLMGQTECAAGTFAQFRESMARYIYVIRK